MLPFSSQYQNISLHLVVLSAALQDRHPWTGSSQPYVCLTLTRQENYWVKGKKGWIRMGYEVEKKMQKYIISFASGQSRSKTDCNLYFAICILQSVWDNT